MGSKYFNYNKLRSFISRYKRTTYPEVGSVMAWFKKDPNKRHINNKIKALKMLNEVGSWIKYQIEDHKLALNKELKDFEKKERRLKDLKELIEEIEKQQIIAEENFNQIESEFDHLKKLEPVINNALALVNNEENELLTKEEKRVVASAIDGTYRLVSYLEKKKSKRL